LDATVLLQGETGCGKTHAARVIHEHSARSSRPFVVVECGALTPTLLASELFGHVRGSFTGADRDYAGKLASAEDGTVFLDEIDTMPLECQAKLLRTVEDRIYQAVGSSKTQTLQARLVVATNRPLDQEVAAGRFRSDLYYRLNVVSFSIPPLRERKPDIQPLAERFLATFSQRAERPIRGFTPRALEAFWCYDWPGNIRELRNAVERSVALCSAPMIDHGDLPEPIQRAHDENAGCRSRLPAAGGCTAGNELAAARMGGELQRLLAALGRHKYNRTNAAAELGISRVTLYKKLRQHRLA
jgi:DNA-binding NtrC family response regulator